MAQPIDPMRSKAPTANHSPHFSFHTLLVVLLSAIQSISGACLALVHAYKSTISTIKLVNQSPSLSSLAEPTPPPITPPPSKLSVSATSSTSSLLIPQSTSSPTQFPITSSGDYASAPIDMFAEVFSTSDRFASATLISTISMISASSMPFLDRFVLTSSLFFVSNTF
jgi:hypothetical protein